MVTFNVDSLDFQDEERARFGNSGEFDLGYNDATDALAIEDRVNSALAEIPRGAETDLIGGKFAQTLDEGKVLNDAGNVYESIQAAVDEADSWVKVGPGTFNESVTIDTAGLKLEGSGERTLIDSGKNDAVYTNQDNVTVRNLSVITTQDPSGGNNYGFISDGAFSTFENCSMDDGDRLVIFTGPNSVAKNCTVTNSDRGITMTSSDNIIVGNTMKNLESGWGTRVTTTGADNCLFAYNEMSDIIGNGMDIETNDNIFYGNRIDNVEEKGIIIEGGSNDNIVAKNRISNTGNTGIDDNGTGTVLDNNLTT